MLIAEGRKLFSLFSCSYRWKNLPLQHRSVSPLVWATGGHIYEEDVFERLSLWTMNLASSYHRSGQMATRRLRGAFLYISLHIVRAGVG